MVTPARSDNCHISLSPTGQSRAGCRVPPEVGTYRQRRLTGDRLPNARHPSWPLSITTPTARGGAGEPGRIGRARPDLARWQR